MALTLPLDAAVVAVAQSAELLDGNLRCRRPKRQRLLGDLLAFAVGRRLQQRSLPIRLEGLHYSLGNQDDR